MQVGDFGAGNRIRTDDLLITNQLLYRLSHTSDYNIISYLNLFCNTFFDFFIKFKTIYIN